MGVSRSRGFTVIEVIIFLAISGLMLLIAFIGTGVTIQWTRFSDSVRSTESYLQAQYDEILNGINPRNGSQVCSRGSVSSGAPGDPPGSSTCVLMGKAVKFTNGSGILDTYYIVGSEPTGVDLSAQTDASLISLYQPQLVTVAGTTDSYKLPWDATVNSVKRQDGVPANFYALIRSPLSSNILAYIFTYDGMSNNLTPFVSDPTNRGKSANVCVKSADVIGSIAAINIASGQGPSTVSSNFNADPATAC
ncbi:MAG: hypothetical protein EOT04_01280 [Candidatus Chaera renei]|uniref:Uncharacterized protein n=1 Tax=Candidatus Chaera renei TaxID=2506947 RepID=A0A4Q0AJ23_9BACT|nr:MAG: hypothetical protein EOT04_01280 [Candidatus Chaera renei]